MKKITLFLLLLSSLYAESKFYMGTGYSFYNENVSQRDGSSISVSSNMASIKAGYGDRKAYAVEFSFDYIDNGNTLFNDVNSTSHTDGIKYGINVDLLKSFDWDIYILPYLKVGIGAGRLDTTLNNGSLNYGSFNAGAGVFVPMSEHFDLELGYNYRYLSYEKEEGLTGTTDPITSHVNLVYLGINARF